MARLRITQYLDLGDERWYCEHCFGSARGNYKEGVSDPQARPREVRLPGSILVTDAAAPAIESRHRGSYLWRLDEAIGMPAG